MKTTINDKKNGLEGDFKLQSYIPQIKKGKWK